MILAAVSHIVFSIVVSRHGVRSVTSTPKQYTWASWAPVPPAYLTQHGYDLITYLGEYYKADNAAIDCAKRNVYVYADIDQRTLETARAYVQGMCGSPTALPIYHDVQTGEGTNDPLFNAEQWVGSQGKISPVASEAAVTAAAASLMKSQSSTYENAFTSFQKMLNYRCQGTCAPITDGSNSIVAKGRLAELGGQLKTASSYAEDVFLEAAECRPLRTMGYDTTLGFASDLLSAMRLHVYAYDVNARNSYNPLVRGGNLFAHIVGMMQDKIGVSHPNVDVPDVRSDAVAFMVGHDTQVGALGGLLNAQWKLGNGLVDNDMPPGGAIVFELYKSDAGEYRVRMRFVYETLPQFMSNAKIAEGVQSVPITFAGCSESDCSAPLVQFASIADGLTAKGFVQKQWTPDTVEPVALAPLTDPAWSSCR